jgi:hypothetical protein
MPNGARQGPLKSSEQRFSGGGWKEFVETPPPEELVA